VHISKRDYMRLAADYRLITDNLIDLSHVPYLHTGLLADREAVVAEVEVTQEGTTVTQTRRSARSSMDFTMLESICRPR
jgi:vanillate O-demethylase monooxygenase subunit